MKTNKQNKSQKQNSTVSGLPIRPEQSSTAPATAPEKAEGDTLSAEGQGQVVHRQTTTVKPYVNFAERDFNRSLPIEKVLEKLRRWNPAQFELAEVVGKWVWITFPEPPDERVRVDLSQLGFHWNNVRKCWQHPCGNVTTRGQQDPRQKYGSHMAAANA